MAKNIGILLLALLFAGFGAFFISRKGNFSPLDSLAGAAGFLTGDQTQKIEKLDSSLKETDSLLRDLKKEISLLRERAKKDAQERNKLKQELETERKTIAALEETLKNQEKAGELRKEEYKKELALFSTKFEKLSGQIAGLGEKIDLLSQRIPEEKKEASSTEAGIKKDSVLCQKKEGEKPRRDKVIFNEIAWMGSASSSGDEWIELKNISGEEVDLSGWQIQNKDQKIKIVFDTDPISAKLTQIGSVLGINGFFLLERTDDETVPGVKADLIYTGAIKNSNEALYLFDKNCQLQDEVLASSTWPAGDNSTKRTMERKSDLSWQTSQSPGGTPKKENSNGYTRSLAVSSGGGGGEENSSMSYPKILISEIQIWDASSSYHDFIELYNPNDSSVTISGYKLRKRTSGKTESSVNVLPSGSIIAGKGYFLWASSKDENYPSSISADTWTKKIISSNNSIALLSPDDTIISALAWGSSTNPFVETSPFPDNPGKNKSLGRIWDEEAGEYKNTGDNSADFEIQTPTPKAKNQSPEPEAEPENQPPIASFSFSPQNPIVGKEISFDASNSTDTDGAITKYLWNFGDNATATGVTATHTFFATGTSTTTLLVTDDRGATSSTSTSIAINENFQPILEISTTSLIFRKEKGENPLSQFILVKNEGNKELNWIATTSADWLFINPATGTVSISSSTLVEISVNTSGLSAGKYQATTTIEAPEAQNSPQKISIFLEIFEPAKNLLKNNFFEDWTISSDNWEWEGTKKNIKQSSEGLVELTLTTTKSFKGFYQYGIAMNSSTTYYAQICLKGKGIVKLGIKYPASKYVYYGEEKAINSEDWSSVSVSKKPTKSGNNGGIKLNLKYDEGQGILKGSKIFIGAAWLGTAPPPENYCSI